MDARRASEGIGAGHGAADQCDPCWLQIPSAREASGANLVKRHAGSRDGGHQVRGLRGRTPLSREVVESAAVTEGLVRTRFVVKADVLGDDAAEVILTEDEDVVEQLSPERTGDAFSEGIHVRRAYPLRTTRLDGRLRPPRHLHARARRWRSVKPICESPGGGRSGTSLR